MKCPKCQTENREGVKFCEECGHDLRKPAEPPPTDYSQPQSYTPKYLADKILKTRSSIEGERKLVTVLFADVANYTSVKDREEREGRNPKTGESVHIPAKRPPFFRIGKELHERINRTFPSTRAMEEDTLSIR